LRRAVFGAVLVLGMPLLAACDDTEGPAERAGEAIDNTARNVTKQTGEAMENLGNAIQQKSREASDAMDNKKPAN
jgi:predicted small secreted protein